MFSSTIIEVSVLSAPMERWAWALDYAGATDPAIARGMPLLCSAFTVLTVATLAGPPCGRTDCRIPPHVQAPSSSSLPHLLAPHGRRKIALATQSTTCPAWGCLSSCPVPPSQGRRLATPTLR